MKSLITEQFMKPEFLDGKLEELKESVSVVIPTYNRLRSLDWCIDSLLKQKEVNMKEIVVVCDGPKDSAKEVIDKYRDESDVDFTLLKVDKRLGSSILRNIGVEKIKNKYLLFSDDDCMFSKYSLFGLLYSYLFLEENSVNVGAMQPPIYVRRASPKGIISKKEIGKLDFNRGETTGNFDLFPSEYLNNAEFIDLKKRILAPFELGHLKGVFLCKKSDYLEAGGFPDHARFNSLLHYGDEIHFSIRLRENGLRLFMNPDPKFSVLHLKYGSDCGYSPDGLSRELVDYVKESDNPLENSGWRVSVEDWYYSKILGFSVLFGLYNSLAVNKWKKRAYDDFVISNSIGFSSSLNKSIKRKEERERIWQKAILDGDDVLKNYYGKIAKK